MCSKIVVACSYRSFGDTNNAACHPQEELLRQRMRGKGTQLAEMIICPIYANLPSELQVGPCAALG